MTMLPPNSLSEFLLCDPVGTLITFTIAMCCFIAAIRFALYDYPTMKMQFDFTHFCLGGACDQFFQPPDWNNVTSVQSTIMDVEI